ncbi:hypothetical protein DSUL_50329 [Desulfovibrionales bacterium]
MAIRQPPPPHHIPEPFAIKGHLYRTQPTRLRHGHYDGSIFLSNKLP